MFVLKNQRLRAEIAEPGEYPNNGFRFDRAGFIADVVLDGAHHFCASEPRNLVHPSSGGRGLCCEFRADYSPEAEEGQYYPKLGIGLIRKEGDYCFYQKYKDLKEFSVNTVHDESSAEFITEPAECLGYGARMKKRILLDGTTIVMECTVENVGKKEIISEEYCHNFLSIDGMAISPDYRLNFPDLENLEEGVLPNQYPTPCNFIADKKGISFARCETEVSLTDILMEETQKKEPFRWSLSHKGAKAKVEVCDFLTPVRITLWAVDHIVSPEIIHRFSIKPGESVSWKRSFTFLLLDRK